MSKLDDNLNLVLRMSKVTLPENRHPSTHHMLKVLAPNPNLSDELYRIAEDFFFLGLNLTRYGDGPELTAGLRKLLEAKDCFIRAALDQDPEDYRDR